MREPESVTVTIFGQEYTLRGDADAEYVQKVARFVDERMQDVARSSSAASTAKVAILAAVNIADELFREQKQRHDSQVTLEDRSDQLARLLAGEIAGGGQPAAESSAGGSDRDGENSLPGT
jgi:cell division protein ZapA